MRKFLFPVILSLLAACGSNSTHWPGLVSGSDAIEQVTEAVLDGTLVCSVRQGRFVPAVLAPGILKLNVEFYYGIKRDRAYKQHDVDNCKETLVTAISLTSDCNFATAPKCFLKPVNKITGAH